MAMAMAMAMVMAASRAHEPVVEEIENPDARPAFAGGRAQCQQLVRRRVHLLERRDLADLVRQLENLVVKDIEHTQARQAAELRG